MKKPEYPKYAKTLGQKIRKQRIDLGKSLLEVARAAGITESYLSRIETDQKMPTAEVAERIAKALHVTPTAYHELLLSDTISNTFANSATTPIEIEKLVKSKTFLQLFKQKKKP